MENNDMSASIEKGNFKVYLETFCTAYGLTEEVAIKHRIVQYVKAYYEQVESETVD